MNLTDLISRINRIRWREQDELAPEAIALIRCHIELIRPIVRHLMRTTGKPVSEAHGLALTPASGSIQEDELIDALASQAEFFNAAVREPLILTFAANELWSLDPELSAFPNPWQPLVSLAYMGYPTSYIDDPDMTAVQLRVGLRDSVVDFPVIADRPGTAGDNGGDNPDRIVYLFCINCTAVLMPPGEGQSEQICPLCGTHMPNLPQRVSGVQT